MQVLEPDMEMQAHMDAETEGEANGCLVWRPIWVTDNMTYTACTGLYPKGQEWVLLLGTLTMALRIRVKGLIGTRYPVSLNAVVEKLRDIIRFILITQTSPIRVFEIKSALPLVIAYLGGTTGAGTWHDWSWDGYQDWGRGRRVLIRRPIRTRVHTDSWSLVLFL